MTHRSIELLAPAKNAEFGMAAIDHGADAVYIGGPAFGARAAAGNDLGAIAALADYAHLYGARVLVALNTILRDDELDEACRVAHRVYDAGADALIVQDMGLFELDLPPIQLHASTQCDIRSPGKARFLAQIGCSQIVLARELALPDIRRIADATADLGTVLEFFVHGALCVSYSGQCYVSHALTGRSANRGECSQICRLPFTLEGSAGETLAQARHLLSLKDNNQSDNLAALIDAGIRSFKIEGRLKDLSYVKNITAHYRRRLDAEIAGRPDLGRASAGQSTFTFNPRPEKTFNRGATDYFVNRRQADIAAFESPKFVGEPVGLVRKVSGKRFEVAGAVAFTNGDGLSWYQPGGELGGARVSSVERQSADGATLLTNDSPAGLVAGATLYRNLDFAFEKLLAKNSASRRLAVDIVLREEPDGYSLALTDETGIAGTAVLRQPPVTADRPETAERQWRDNLGKLGGTPLRLRDLRVDTRGPRFLPAGAINTLRRDAVAALLAARRETWQRPPRAAAVEPPPAYPESELSYLANIYNARARAFYERHGVRLAEAAYETNAEPGEVSLMITKHCLRYSFNLCPKQVRGIKPEPMTLWQESPDGSRRAPLKLRFDCGKCEMHVIGKLHGKRAVIPIKNFRT